MIEPARTLLETLVFSPDNLSRNQNFELFKDPEMAQVRRVAAMLRSLCEAVREPGVQALMRPSGPERWEVMIENSRSHLRRRAWLGAQERDVLLQDRLFREAVGDAPPDRIR